MLLAAVLGATVVDLLPPSALVARVSFGEILLVSLIAAFLPVPMAFDVAIAYIAWTGGVPLPYVVTILCTLGIVSVYSLSVVGSPCPGRWPLLPTPVSWLSARWPAYSPAHSLDDGI